MLDRDGEEVKAIQTDSVYFSDCVCECMSEVSTNTHTLSGCMYGNLSVCVRMPGGKRRSSIK